MPLIAVRADDARTAHRAPQRVRDGVRDLGEGRGRAPRALRVGGHADSAAPPFRHGLPAARGAGEVYPQGVFARDYRGMPSCKGRCSLYILRVSSLCKSVLYKGALIFGSV